MLNYNYCNPTRIIFGRNTQHEVGDLLRPLGKRILLVYGGGSIKRSGLYDAVIASLSAADLYICELGGVLPNPRLDLVREGIALCRKEAIDVVLAVGGGSVIDTCKAIAVGVPDAGDVWDFFLGTRQPVAALPVATILTLPAAGSESSISVVISDEPGGKKIGFNSELVRPVFSIINPELYVTLPPEQIAYGVCDMICHILERYFTNTTHTDVIDGMAEAAVRAIMRNALILRNNPHDYNAWAEVALGGNLAHNGLFGLGRQEDWGSHKLEHALSAVYDVPHGAGLAVITPAWMRYVWSVNPSMFVQFAVNMMGVDGSLRDPEALIERGIAQWTEFLTRMGLPTTLTALGIDATKLEYMAHLACDMFAGPDKRLGNLKKLDWQDNLAILQIAL